MGKVDSDSILSSNDIILVTGAGGFIGRRVVMKLMEFGFQNIRCLVRSTNSLSQLEALQCSYEKIRLDIVRGNLLSKSDCDKAAKDVKVVFHLAAGRGEKSYPQAFMDSVVTTRNLLESVRVDPDFRRFVNVSSLSVYSNLSMRRGAALDETCPIESRPELRGDAYTFAKVGQELILKEYAEKYGIPYVILRPGVVYGPGNKGIHSRIGIDTFGFFLHLGGGNKIPLSYVDNCAEAIVLAGVRKGIDGEVFNVIDDQLPTSRQFLMHYKRRVRQFKSVYAPYWLFYLFSYCWEKYSTWSGGQLPLAFNRRRCSTYWKGNQYPNSKAKELLGWHSSVSFEDAMQVYCDNERSDNK
jgi:nucleoside-diphosphate-sugar epimerase